MIRSRGSVEDRLDGLPDQRRAGDEVDPGGVWADREAQASAQPFIGDGGGHVPVSQYRWFK
jgi:hypothetical protein